MKFRYLFLLIASIVLYCNTTFGQAVGTNVFLQGRWVEVGIAANGSWGPATAPAGYHPGPGPNLAMVYDWGHDGWTTGTPPKFGDYVFPGTPFEGWQVQVNGARSDAFFTTSAGTGFYNAMPATSTLSGSNASFTLIPGVASCGSPSLVSTAQGEWKGTAGPGGGLNIRQTTRLDTNASWVVVTTVFTNTTATDMTGLYYERTADPDNDETYSFNFQTINTITYQNDVDHRVLAGSYGTMYHQAYMALATKDCRAKCLIYQDWPPTTVTGNNLDLVYAGTATGLGSTYYTPGQTTIAQDIAIGLVYNLGTLHAGDSTLISYAYIFSDSTAIDSAFPEPQLFVNCVPVAPSGPPPAPTYDTFYMCSSPGLGLLAVSVKNATDKNWSWSSWTWSPSVGLASTTGVNNLVTLSALSGPTTYTITGTDSAVDMYSCNHRVMYLTIIPCFNATSNSPGSPGTSICQGDTLKLYAHGDSTGATYIWYGPGTGGPVIGTSQNINIPNVPLTDTGTFYVIRTVDGSSDTTSTHVVIKPKPIIMASNNGPICSGNTIVLTSSPDSVGETWLWTGPVGFTSTSSDPTIPGAPVMYTGTYQVIATLNGCKDTAFTSVVVDSTPAVPVIGSNTPVCTGDTLQLTSSDATPGVSYSWTGPAGFTSALENPSVPNITMPYNGIYTVTVKLGICTNSNTTPVEIRPTPLPVLGSNSPVCSGTSLNLTETDTLTGSTFSWTGPNSYTSVLQNPSVDPATTAATGLYSVVVTHNGCPSAMVTINTEVDSTPATPLIGSNSAICSGDTLLLTSSTATIAVIGYNWSGPGGFSSTLENPFIANAPTTASGTYTVTVTFGTCSSSSTTLVTVKQTPSLPILGSNSPVCSGTSLNFTSSSTAGSMFDWTGPLSFTANVQDPVINPAYTNNTGTYSVVATLDGCSSPVATIHAEVDTTPQLAVAGSNSPGTPGPTICQGDTLKLTVTDATAGVNYNWSGPEGFSSTLQNPDILLVTPAASGAYTVIVAAGACTTEAIITVTVTPTPPLTAGSNSPVCTGDNDTLQLTATSGTGATYTWSGPYVFTSGAQNPFRTPVVSEYGGIYIVTALLNGCTATVNDTVVVHPTPAPPWLAWLTYCQSYPAPPLMGYGENILWYSSSAPGGTGSSVPPIPSTTTPGNTFYYASQTVAGCLSAIDSMQVTVNPKPGVTVTPSYAVCPHDTALLVAVDSVKAAGETTSDTITGYHWFPDMYLGDTTGSSVVTRPETDIHYWVVASNQYGCTDTALTVVSVYASAVITLPDTVTIYPGESYQISPQTNCSSFMWSPAGGLNDAYISNPVAMPPVSTKYVVTGVTESGCITKDSINIYVSTESILALPNAFTPGSGSNNEFKVIKRGIATLRSFRIFDRWGVKVFETTDIDQGWDGTYKGKPQPFGVYVYEIEAVTSTDKDFVKQGNITLIR